MTFGTAVVMWEGPCEGVINACWTWERKSYVTDLEVVGSLSSACRPTTSNQRFSAFGVDSGSVWDPWDGYHPSRIVSCGTRSRTPEI